MTRTVLFITSLLSITLACEQDQACTREARGSVNVSVVDPSGAPTDAFDSITYESSTFSEDCECWEPGECVCGWELEGDIDITVRACDGSQIITESVQVQSDECHVIPQALTIQLHPCDQPAI